MKTTQIREACLKLETAQQKLEHFERYGKQHGVDLFVGGNEFTCMLDSSAKEIVAQIVEAQCRSRVAEAEKALQFVMQEELHPLPL
jgi:hypothetical protein